MATPLVSGYTTSSKWMTCLVDCDIYKG